MKRGTEVTGRYLYQGKTDWFVHGCDYTLTIRRTIFGRVKICIQHGYYDLPYSGSMRTYRNWEEFLKEWRKNSEKL